PHLSVIPGGAAASPAESTRATRPPLPENRPWGKRSNGSATAARSARRGRVFVPQTIICRSMFPLAVAVLLAAGCRPTAGEQPPAPPAAERPAPEAGSFPRELVA